MFRGRAGPTDSRLPKHNARRRKQQGQTQRETRDVQEEEPVVLVPPEEEEACDGEDGAMIILDSEEEKVVVEEEEEDVPIPVPKKDNPCCKEMEHLQKRVKKVRESIQLSNAIANPTTYQQNVLNVVVKCVNELRSIVTHHHQELDPDDPTTKKTSLAVFDLMQHSLQCGPLAGAKPGYFKRCGSQVAMIVYDYLDQIVPHPELGQRMGFTAKQLDVLAKWKSNAQKAAENDKPPSKPALLKQQNKKKKKG
jgi:hypothetical protein